ncbi:MULTISPECIES: peptide deformylase [unclassified Campylobacter]|uniref:peptide deformylase n=1 Tax=unclassified Campylobacter TaxID=2593542 RepID=UPI0012381D67|nr:MULTISPECIES: peptide deformylase [unclassified Campylobacter]KAA6225126.1 peptide deformylase [Campylobacter sp. LR196d]KAA6226140.1 peptide deformylase [Campylobacter sp. LR185c]KAA6228088.1 peptide deformylase [Campylobacter sp. LR286c]KAA6231340.1 peptide deformylase [Campylobacter sp. LR264d]KAA6231552.1 peptide deformylase [Campylobacter sp. LR291e]
MIRKIITYPNKRLFLTSKEVLEFDSKLHILLDDMYETMIANNGVGIAAIQVDVPLRALLVNILDENEEQKKENLLEIINPKITPLGDEQITCTEGCLSVPEFFEEVNRYKHILLEYQDRFGEFQRLEASDFLAVAIQHENDHLDGHLFIERISYLKRKKFDTEFKKKQKLAKKNEKA